MFKQLIRVSSVAVPIFILQDQWRNHNSTIYALAEKPNPLDSVPIFENQKLPDNDILSKSLCKKSQKVKKAIHESKSILEMFRAYSGTPGLVVGVSHRGKEVWTTGIGLADVETGAKCNDKTVMRVASISKSITMTLLGKLLEEGKLDLDKPIHEYLGDKFPIKKWQGKQVNITLRQLLSHTGGIRHYRQASKKERETEKLEYYITEPCPTVYDGLKYFKDDELVAEPGSKFVYSTYGFTLVSAIIQSVLPSDRSFEKELLELVKKRLGMYQTYADKHKPIIPYRAKFYENRDGKLLNVPFVDNSYKLSGGGLLSNVHDLLKFGNAMLYSLITEEGLLKTETMQLLFTPHTSAHAHGIPELNQWSKYGLGFVVVNKEKIKATPAQPPFDKMIWHTGAALGATSILLILPEQELVVTVVSNLDSCPGVGTAALNVAKAFHKHLN